MNKIGILTFQFAHNYGAVLQAFALKRTVSNKNTTVQIINYLPDGLWESYSLNPIYAIKKGQLKKILNLPKRLNQAVKFYSFQKKYLQLKKPIRNIDINTVKDFDTLIVGSDQVWSDSILTDVSPYFFEGIDNVIKISYAASFGTKELSQNIISKIHTCLPLFKEVTVRERSSIELIKEVEDRCVVTHVCDPVFLLSAEEWRNIYNKTRNEFLSNKNYILYIDLRNDIRLINEAKKLRNDTGLDVIYIHPTCWRTTEKSFTQLYNVGPFEYLRLIDNAEYIVTNSFHAVAFSMIFKKKIIHIANKNLGSRVQDLFDTFSVKDIDGLVDCSELEVCDSEFVHNSKQKLSDLTHLGEGR